MSHALRRRIAATAVAAGLLAGGVAGFATPAFADGAPATASATATPDPIGDVLRGVEVDYAEAHWSWTAWNDSTPVAFGAGQDKYQCAEYVARALAAAGLVPGLGPDDPQDDYFTYTAPNGKVYDLLLISDLPQYHNLYDYLMDSGLGTDIGDHPEQARPGDVVVTYAGPGGAKSHTGLVAQAATATAEPTVDAHNRARLHYGYHFYAPSHLVRIDPLGLLNGFFGTATQGLSVQPKATPAPAPKAKQNTKQDATPNFALSDPAGPQV